MNSYDFFIYGFICFMNLYMNSGCIKVPDASLAILSQLIQGHASLDIWSHLVQGYPNLRFLYRDIQGYPGLPRVSFSRCWHRSCKQALWTLPGPVWKLLGPVNWGKSDWTRQSLCHDSISQFQSDTAMLSLPLTRRGLPVLFALNLCLLNERGRGKKNEGVWVTVLVLSNSSAQNLNGEHRDQQSWSESSSISLRR